MQTRTEISSTQGPENLVITRRENEVVFAIDSGMPTDEGYEVFEVSVSAFNVGEIARFLAAQHGTMTT